MFKNLLAVLPLFFIMSCASLSEDSCRAGNWSSIGFNDGTNGRLESYIKEHRESCAEYGIRPDVAVWRAARIEGLKQYCTPVNAYSEGRDGDELNPVCSENIDRLQLANFYGLQYYEISERIDDLEDEIDDLRDRIETEFTREMSLEERALRRFYREKIEDAEDEIRDLEWDLRRYEDLP